MKKRVAWAIAFLVVGAAAILMVLPSSRNSLMVLFGKDPVYKGKTATQWMESLQEVDADGHPTRAAEKAKWALNFVRLEAEDPMPVVRLALRNSDNNVRTRACEIVGGLGEFARSALPDLIDLAKDKQAPEKLREEALKSIMFIGPEKKNAVGVLTALLKDENPKIRAQAANNLWWIAEDAAGAVPALLEAARDKDRRVARAAGAAVWTIDPEAARKGNIDKPEQPLMPRMGG